MTRHRKAATNEIRAQKVKNHKEWLFDISFLWKGEGYILVSWMIGSME
jgi:hypothetical protein